MIEGLCNYDLRGGQGRSVLIGLYSPTMRFDDLG
jgi:hypothetical protein